jgi:hypothetical protein
MIYRIKNLTTQEEKSAADWGVDEQSIQIRLENLAIDYLYFSTQELFDATPQFTNGTLIELFRQDDEIGTNRRRLFYGRVDKIKRIGTDGTEALSYTIAGPWYWLERTIYVATWKIFENPLSSESALIDFENSHVILLLKNDGTKIKTAAQILTLMNYVITAGAPFTYDATGCPDVDMPLDEVRDLSPAECLRRLIRLVPNCSSWFDYSTSPLPTLYLKQRPALAERNLSVEDINQVELDERHDLVTSGVILTYEKTHLLNGVGNTILDRRAYPPGASASDLNPIAASINLEGAIRNTVSVTFETEEAPVHFEKNVDWWKSREATISQANIADLSLADTNRQISAPEYRYVVKSNVVPEWVGPSEQDVITTAATYSVKLGDTVLDKVRDEPLRQNVTVTTKPGGTYQQTVEAISEEATPVGLEEAIYNAMSVLHYDGKIVVQTEDGEIDPTLSIGTVINITGMRAEWATMKAQVQNIVHDLSSGLTTIQVGPPKHLGIDDIIEILRLTRFRMRWTAAITPTSGRSSGGTNVALSGNTAENNTQKGRGELDMLTIARKIVLDPTAAHGLDIAFREVKYCDEGVEKYMIVLGSVLYENSINPEA